MNLLEPAYGLDNSERVLLPRYNDNKLIQLDSETDTVGLKPGLGVS